MEELHLAGNMASYHQLYEDYDIAWKLNPINEFKRRADHTHPINLLL